MRQLLSVFAGVGLAALCAFSAGAGEVVVTGPHICCPQCVSVAKKILSKVDGVTDAKADVKSKTITFKAKDVDTAKAGLKAIYDGGFFGSATDDGKALKIDVVTIAKGDKADVVVVKDVHVCCKACEKAINNVFKDGKVSYEGNGPQRTVRINSTNLDRGEVLESLRKAGFTGTVEK